ncbi:MAG: hypothetical protein IKE30_05015 [Clostridia bacterium]|nr:hypothetical protein [Clostridia bacterium]
MRIVRIAQVQMISWRIPLTQLRLALMRIEQRFRQRVKNPLGCFEGNLLNNEDIGWRTVFQAPAGFRCARTADGIVYSV